MREFEWSRSNTKEFSRSHDTRVSNVTLEIPLAAYTTAITMILGSHQWHTQIIIRVSWHTTSDVRLYSGERWTLCLHCTFSRIAKHCHRCLSRIWSSHWDHNIRKEHKTRVFYMVLSLTHRQYLSIDINIFRLL